MPTDLQRPDVTTEDAERLAVDWYGQRVAATELPSERDRNFLLRTHGGEQLVLKIANATEQSEWLEFENEVLGALASHETWRDRRAMPRLHPNRDGDGITRATIGGNELRARLLSHVPGVPLARFRPHSAELLRAIGRLLGELDGVLRECDRPQAHREFHWDLAHAKPCFGRGRRAFVGEQRDVIELAAELYGEHAGRLSEVPRSVIHGDANDYNVLVHADRLGGVPNVGLIDFGDMLHSFTIAEVAVAAAYAMLGADDPLAPAGQVLAGYHDVAPLSELEVEVLFPLILARLCMSATFAAEQHQRAPDNDYLLISQEPVWALLKRLRDVDPRMAHAVFRGACGWPVTAAAPRVSAWLLQRGGTAASVVEPDLGTDPRVVLDLSVGSAELGNPRLLADVDAFSDYVFGRMKSAGARVGVGRYGEARQVYTSDLFDAGAGRRRTVHLGIDLFLFAGTPIAAPLDGVVHSVANNAGAGDYGPTIVLEHRVEDDLVFYTLYGHLSVDSLDGVAAGQEVARGQRFAKIGGPPSNGGWPPHLHFQVITDMLGHEGDFPGVALPDERAFWCELCPDPSAMLRLPAESAAPMPDRRVRDVRGRRLGGSLSLSYREPLHIVRGSGAHLFDVDGRRYLDCVNNVCHVGHCHPRVVGAALRQAAVLNTNTRYLHENIVRYAERLTAAMPPELSVCYFVNSGSEANELALRLARAHTGRHDVVVLEGAYHGNTTTLIDVSPYKHAGPGGGGAPDWVHVVPVPDGYRGPHRGRGPDVGASYAEYVGETVDAAGRFSRPVGAFLCESIPSCAGQIVLPEAYLREAYRHVHAAGAVCIADEVQVGMGRVGPPFWAFDVQGVVPDIVTLGKPIGNGHPLAAVVTTAEIAASFANGMEYFNTFGGNPVSCAVGLAVMDVLADENLPSRAATVGRRLLAGLEDLKRQFPLIGDVRGIGMFLGIELVTDPEARTPAPDHAAHVVERMKERGILLSTDGPLHNVIKIKPPLVFSEADADQLLNALADVLGETALAL